MTISVSASEDRTRTQLNQFLNSITADTELHSRIAAGIYTPASVGEFNDARNAAITLLFNLRATAAEITQAYWRLRDAIANLDDEYEPPPETTATEPPTELPDVSRAHLMALVNEIARDQNTYRALYDGDLVDIVLGLFPGARTIGMNLRTSQLEVNEAYWPLRKAFEAMKASGQQPTEPTEPQTDPDAELKGTYYLFSNTPAREAGNGEAVLVEDPEGVFTLHYQNEGEKPGTLDLSGDRADYIGLLIALTLDYDIDSPNRITFDLVGDEILLRIEVRGGTVDLVGEEGEEPEHEIVLSRLDDPECLEGIIVIFEKGQLDLPPDKNVFYIYKLEILLSIFDYSQKGLHLEITPATVGEDLWRIKVTVLDPSDLELGQTHFYVFDEEDEDDPEADPLFTITVFVAPAPVED
jgi:hypothetical protein